MGGTGSGRRRSKKRTVQECAQLDIRDVPKEGFAERFESGVALLDKATGKFIYMTRTACTYGGWRYWLICPLCSRRCGKLYRVGRYSRCACRICLNLTYSSAQDARKYNNRLMPHFRFKWIMDRWSRLEHRQRRQRPGSKASARIQQRINRLYERVRPELEKRAALSH